ncbi:hypothetical protein CVT26_008263 [Gymnopilus dilepis]|uniref:Uncharacterized protein n=1 Tax=Gymnopilus dilepis TaxID=231916 RepID=A0A409YFQ1_9AGAR|nr:hypothetical protein CVT26_008263 [Gymnopilus dilepis]
MLLRAKVTDGNLSEGEVYRLCRASVQHAEAKEVFDRKRIQKIRTLHLTDTDQTAPPTVILTGSIAMTVAQAVEDVLTVEKELVDMQVAECIAHLQILGKIQEDVASCRVAATD